MPSADSLDRSFDLSPVDRIAQRQKAYDAYLNIAEPALSEQQQGERGKLAADVYAGVGQAALMGRPDKGSQILGAGVEEAAKMLPTQGKASDAAMAQGATMKEDIIGARQQGALTRFQTGTEETKVEVARELAAKVFAAGVSVQELTLHNNGYLADEALKRLYEDLGAGRVNEAEIQKLINGVALKAEYARRALAKDEARLKGELSLALSRKDYKAALDRYAKLLQLQKDALRESARAGNMAAILSAGGAVIGGLYGGAPGAAAGSELGKVAGGTIKM